jgi:hypothetical protein
MRRVIFRKACKLNFYHARRVNLWSNFEISLVDEAGDYMSPKWLFRKLSRHISAKGSIHSVVYFHLCVGT